MSTLKVNTLENTSGNPDIVNVGKVVAVKRAELTTKFTCSSTDFVDSGLEVTHTAASSSNLILLNAHIVISGNFWNHSGYYVRLHKDSTAIGSVGSGGSSFNTPIYANFSAVSAAHTQSHGFLNHVQHMEAVGDTSSHTYKVKVANNSNSYPTYYNGTTNSASVAHMVLMEIAA
tara:strand:- start:289 stop:810 length:522 start_codon:yes stop_codon:yes gene_type:complete